MTNDKLFETFPENEYFYFSDDKLEKWIKSVYDLSVTVGMGFLHYKGGELPENSLQSELQRFSSAKPENHEIKHKMYHIDYLMGRCCKANAIHFFEHGKIAINKNHWYDHHQGHIEKLKSLLSE